MKRDIVIFSALAALAVTAAFAALGFGSVRIGINEITGILAGHNAGTDNYQIIMKIRLPRVAFAMLVGGMLAVSGAMLQGIFKNPLVDPFITGISSGAALGASAAIVAGIFVIMLPAMAGAVMTIFAGLQDIHNLRQGEPVEPAFNRRNGGFHAVRRHFTARARYSTGTL